MVAGSPRLIPQFIAASSPRELMRRMLLNNLKFGRQFQYFTIVKDGAKWVAWFYKEVDIKIVVENTEVKTEIVSEVE